MGDKQPWWREAQCCAESPGQECWCAEACTCGCPDCACGEGGDAWRSAGLAMLEGFRRSMDQAAKDIRAAYPVVAEAVRKALADGEIIPCNLAAEPANHVLVQPGWGERLTELVPRATGQSMATVEVDLSDVTVCAPCDQGAEHPESHAAYTVILADRVPEGVPDDRAVASLVHVVRNGMQVSGPITVHKSPHSDVNTATFGLAHEWIATQP